MLLKSLVISLIVGYLLIFIFTPLFLKAAMKGKPQNGNAKKQEN